jgi:proline iminopeptidase
MTTTSNRRTRGRGRRVAFVGLLVAAVFGASAAVVAAAAFTPLPAGFLGAGWVVLAIGVGVASRVLPAGRRARGGLVALVVLSLIGGFVLLWPGSTAVPAPPPGIRWVDLPTGSRLAYQELPAIGDREEPPVIFLHGGPGVADMAGDLPYLRRLADAGWQTYVYDQYGAGRSARAADPTDYSLDRAVADLDAFRQAIGTPQVDLLGYSWGSTLAAAYLAAHPDHVARVVFASPGPMVGGASDVTDLLGRTEPGQVAAVLGQALQPRALLTWVLDQVDPRAAHAYAGDAEMDARFRAIGAAAAPALYCSPPRSTAADGGDVGFYANATLLRSSAWRDPHAALRRSNTPALVVKGSCDYVSWSSATDYRDTLPGAELVYLPGAGHRAYAERPDAFFAAVTAFLAGQPLPVAPYSAAAAPPDFEGPGG